MSLYDSLVRYGKRLPLPGRRGIRPIHLRDLDAPIYLRLGSSDGFVIEEIFAAGVYDCVTTADLGPVRLIVDLGANAGYSLRLWRRHYPQARIIAVEPDAENFAMAKKNAAVTGGDVTLIEAAVAARPGYVRLDRSAEECAIRVLESAEAVDGIPARTLPEILATCGAADAPIDLLKCDIEGAEQEVFADCAPWIGQVRHLMIELHPPYSRQMLMNDLSRAGAGFETLWHGITAGNDLLFLKQAHLPA